MTNDEEYIGDELTMPTLPVPNQSPANPDDFYKMAFQFQKISKIQLISRLSQLAHARSFGLDYVACSSLGALCSLKPCAFVFKLAK